MFQKRQKNCNVNDNNISNNDNSSNKNGIIELNQALFLFAVKLMVYFVRLTGHQKHKG